MHLKCYLFNLFAIKYEFSLLQRQILTCIVLLGMTNLFYTNESKLLYFKTQYNWKRNIILS